MMHQPACPCDCEDILVYMQHIRKQQPRALGLSVYR